MAHRTPMTAEQYAEYKALDAKVQASMQRAPVGFPAGPSNTEWERWRMFRDYYAPPPQRPAVGTPGTYSIGSDRYAGTVVGVFSNGREIWLEVDRLGVLKFTYRPTDGAYRERGQRCGRLSLGVAEDYRDPSY